MNTAGGLDDAGLVRPGVVAARGGTGSSAFRAPRFPRQCPQRHCNIAEANEWMRDSPVAAAVGNAVAGHFVGVCRLRREDAEVSLRTTTIFKIRCGWWKRSLEL